MDPAVVLGLADADPFGEWLDPHAHPELARLVALGVPRDDGGYEPLGGYDASVSLMRSIRPSTAGVDNPDFWSAPLHRAHLLNAVLRRGRRSLGAVGKQLDIAENKVHSYLKRFGIRFVAHPRKHVSVLDWDGLLYNADVVSVDRERRGYARLRVWEFPDLVEGRWSPANQAYRALRPLSRPMGIIPLEEAERLLGVHRRTLSRALTLAGERCNERVYLAHLARLFPETGEYMDEAVRVYGRTALGVAA